MNSKTRTENTIDIDDHELESRTLCVRRDGARCTHCGECEEDETEGWTK